MNCTAMTSHSPPSEDPIEVLRWANGRFGDRLVVTASFGDATLVHLVASTIPEADVVLLDTGYLFAETDWYADDLRRRYGLNLRTIHPLPGTDRDVWRSDTNACCAAQGGAAQPGAARQKRLGHRAAAQRWAVSGRCPGRGERRRPQRDEDQPDRRLDRRRRGRLRGGQRPAGAPAGRPGLCLDRLLALHGAGRRGRRRAGRWAGDVKTECGLHLAQPALVGAAVTLTGSGITPNDAELTNRRSGR